MTVAETILAEAKTLPEGAVISAKELLHLGNRAAVDQALSRLGRSKKLMRIGHGLYVRPVESRFGTRAPTPAKVVAQLAEANAETVAPHGAAAANKLGLTTQVPTKVIYYTSGPNRRIKLGAQIVELKHAPNWLLLSGAGRAGEAVRALAWIGKQHASEALSKLKRTLSEAEVNELVARRRVLPGWLSQSISRSLMQHG
ncbi:DUF6088 family protein [Bradyrhizobium sp. 2S1]|uniref:DUF6088 family protein n=1 Tax=Bradyrhizobium sp. 2S1 TaxID=1404429 RepID=UPI001407D549|nr:DUF6088 family protein [Bradyrhizobium sp. 2S1]MCK7664540.1 DUF6088 family protein [Bradyrhizobium sp. 2S1]